MRTMGLDIGTRRVGVAVSDPMGWTAQPLETVLVQRDGAWMARIAALCKDLDVSTLVAGVPLEMSGQPGVAARRVRLALAAISDLTGLPIIELDERLTSRQAERALLEGDVRRQERKGVIDQLAACLILQSHLDAQRRP
jgi:putative Holliday junction resolvase